MRKSCNCISAPVENGSECLTCLAKGLKQDKESHMKRLAKVKLESSWHKRVWVDPWKHQSFLSTPNKRAMPVHGHAFFMPTFIVQHSTKCRVKSHSFTCAAEIALNLRDQSSTYRRSTSQGMEFTKWIKMVLLPTFTKHRPDWIYAYLCTLAFSAQALALCLSMMGTCRVVTRLGAQKLICEDLGCWDTSMSSERFLAFDKRGLGKDVHQLSTPL